MPLLKMVYTTMEGPVVSIERPVTLEYHKDLNQLLNGDKMKVQ